MIPRSMGTNRLAEQTETPLATWPGALCVRRSEASACRAERQSARALAAVARLDVVTFGARRVVVVHATTHAIERACLCHLANPLRITGRYVAPLPMGTVPITERQWS